MRPKDGLDAKIQTGTFILSEKIDDTKTKKSEKELKKEIKKLEKEKLEQEKKEKKAREKEKERERQAKRGESLDLQALTRELVIEEVLRYHDVISGFKHITEFQDDDT